MGRATGPIRVAVVKYLNTRALVHKLDGRSDLFDLEFDVPSRCATLLHDGVVDLAMLSAIEYLRRSDYRVVPGVAVASNGPVNSVALYTTRQVRDIRSIALDSSSCTAVALLRILCAQWFGIEPEFVTMRPDLPAMLERCDAGLLIGDPALFASHDGVDKIDLGEQWTAMTGLPFVWCFWTGHRGRVQPEHVHALHAARDAGMSSLGAIAAAHRPGDAEQAAIVHAYLRDNLQFGLTDDGGKALERYFGAAADLGIVPETTPLHFFDA